MIYVIGIIILLLVICFFIFFFKYAKLKDFQKSLDMCSISIDEILTKKLGLIRELIKDLKDERIEKTFEYDETGSIYEREDALFNAGFEINKFVKDKSFDDKVNSKKNQGKGKKKKKSNDDSIITDELLDKMKTLNEMEESIDGLKDYYNANVLNYNEIYLKKYLNKLFKLLKFPVYKSFKIRKLEEYEIFKN